MTTPQGRTVIALLLIVLVLSLAACATPSAPPKVQPPQLPRPPAILMEPPEPGLWSDLVQELLLRWRQSLTRANPA